MADSHLQQKQMLLGDDGELVVPRSRDEVETIPETVASESPSRASRNLWIVLALLASWVGSGVVVILDIRGQGVEAYILAYLSLVGFTICAGHIIVVAYNAFPGDHLNDARRVYSYWASVESAVITMLSGLGYVLRTLVTVLCRRRWW